MFLEKCIFPWRLCYNVRMKSMIGFGVFVLLVLGLLYAVSGKRYTQVPDDVLHRNVELTDSAACLKCHGPGREAALKQDHPPKYECHQCHKPKRIRR